MSTFQGSTNHALLQSWLYSRMADELIVPTEAQTLADRANWLGANDPFVAALYAAHLQGVLGPSGLRLSSLFDLDPSEQKTTENSRNIRRAINAIVQRSWVGTGLDAEGARTRWQLEAALDHMAFFTGDGFAIRVERDGKSAWRLVSRDRVCNPDGKYNNTEEWRDGFKLRDGQIVGINVTSPSYGYGFTVETKRPDIFVSWYAEDGTPNVIHKPGLRLPGMLRGVSRISPLIVMQRQVGSVLESHVAGKRLQAIFGMIVEASDPEQWQAAVDAGSALGAGRLRVDGPLQVWVKKEGTSPVQFPEMRFNGADLDQYLRTCWAVQCATMQMPLDVVLCQMGNASLSSARAGLDQFDRTCQTEQEHHIATVTSVIDSVAISDSIVLGQIDVQGLDFQSVAVGKHSRPPKYSTDRKKDAETIKTLVEAGLSKTTTFEMFGFSYEDEEELKRSEAEFEAAQDDGSQRKDAAFIDRVKAASDKIISSGVEGLSWPIVIASNAANTAPGAFIQALSSPEATGSTAAVEPDTVEPSMPEDNNMEPEQ